MPQQGELSNATRDTYHEASEFFPEQKDEYKKTLSPDEALLRDKEAIADLLSMLSAMISKSSPTDEQTIVHTVFNASHGKEQFQTQA